MPMKPADLMSPGSPIACQAATITPRKWRVAAAPAASSIPLANRSRVPSAERPVSMTAIAANGSKKNSALSVSPTSLHSELKPS